MDADDTDPFTMDWKASAIVSDSHRHEDVSSKEVIRSRTNVKSDEQGGSARRGSRPAAELVSACGIRRALNLDNVRTRR